MKEQFVTYEIALKLKNLGFNEFCMGFFYSEHIDELSDISLGTTTKVVEEMVNRFNCIKAPLWQQVIDWFRNLHGVIIEVYIPRYIPYEYNFAIYYPDELTKNHLNEKYFNEIIYDYNVAREIAILKAIELCKKN